MTNTRIWGLVCGAAILVTLVSGWFFGVQPQLAAAEQADGSTTQVIAQNQQTAAKIAQLARTAARADAMKAENAVLQRSVPSLLKANRFIRRVRETAALDGAKVVSIAPADAVSYTVPPSLAGTAPVAADGQPAAVPLAKSSPLITGALLTVVPVTVTISATPDVVLQFTKDLQSGERIFAVSGLQSTRDGDTGLVTASVTGSIYTLKR